MRALYSRVVAKHPQHKAIAIGHAMRTLLHLAFAIWKSGRPFDPEYYPWDRAAHTQPGEHAEPGAAPPAVATTEPKAAPAAGHKPELEPAGKVVATAGPRRNSAARTGEQVFLNFAHLKRQLPLARVLDQLGLLARLRGSGPQRRCACPIHRGDGRGTSFSVNLDDHVFHGGSYSLPTLVVSVASSTLPAKPVQVVPTSHSMPTTQPVKAVAAVHSTKSAQGVANIMASYGTVGHWGGNPGYEGCGMGATPEAAYNSCCYSNSGMATVDVGYAGRTDGGTAAGDIASAAR